MLRDVNRGLSRTDSPTGRSGEVQVIRSERENQTFNSKSVEKKRVCAYCRVSTAEESQATSYDLQVSYYTDYIKRNSSWKFAGVYADEGISGTSTKNREQFLQMIQDCRDGKIDYIITKSISRFARNTLDCLQYIRELKNLPKPVGVFFEKENLDTLDGKSEFFLTILSSIAQEESRTISENTKWGIQKRFQQGKAHCPTTYFLGYDTDENGKLVINEDEAAIVRRIYQEFLSGKGSTVIAKGLMKDGIRTIRGNKNWTSNAVYRMLTNEKYCGDILMQKSVTIDFLTHKRVPNEGHQPQYFIQDHHPAIIPKEDWHAVQEELKRRSDLFHDPDGKYRQKYSGRMPFSNVLFCAECGRPVTRRRLTTKRKGEKFLFTAWQCRMASGREKGKKDCWARYIWEESLEKAFMEMLYQMKDNKEEVIADAKAAIELVSLSKIAVARIRNIENQYNALSERLNQLAGSNIGANADIYDSTIKQLNYEQGILRTEWEQLMEKKQKSVSMEKQLATLLEILDELDDDPDNYDFRDDIFQQIVHRGIMQPEGEVDFELKCGATIPAKAFVRATTWNWKAK